MAQYIIILLSPLTHSMANIPGKPRLPVSECQTILGFTVARDDGSGTGSNRNFKTFKALVTTPKYQQSKFCFTSWIPCLSPNQQSQALKAEHIQAGYPACHPTNSVKALKAHTHCAEKWLSKLLNN